MKLVKKLEKEDVLERDIASRQCRRAGEIDGTSGNGIGAGEIEMQRALVHGQRQLHAQRFVLDAVVVDKILGVIDAVGEDLLAVDL